MNYVDSVEIYGFWGSKNVNVTLHPDLNFLIGPNGSGKTTVINLIAAVLRADIAVLYSVQFERAIVRLRARRGNKKPVIEIKKSVDDEDGNLKLYFTVKEKSSDRTGLTYIVDGPLEEKIYRDPRYNRIRRMRQEGARLSRAFERIAEVNLLTIHRRSMEIDRRQMREENFESSVDQKLNEVSRSFSSYFSSLSSAAADESQAFQEQVLLSLLDQEYDLAAIFRQVDQELVAESTVVNVLKELGISGDRATKSVGAHLSRLAKAITQWKKDEFSLEEAITLSDARRVNEMIDQWRNLQRKRDEIFRPRVEFENIINEMFTGKTLRFDARNFPIVRLKSGDEVPVSALSSGEKQLFIILGEALLQEGRLVIFISDEPELSLHVNWQNSLFSNVRRLNNSCQVITATHSPDIVGTFQDRVIKVEECMSNVQ